MSATELREGTVIENRYRVGRHLGRGGFAQVYEAEHVQLARRAALKVLDVHGRDDESFLKRFQREAQIYANFEHPNVVRVFDFGVIESTRQPYIAMELLEGHDLEAELRLNGALAPRRAVRLFTGCLDALADAHSKGIIHKDLKPSNLFLANVGQPNERLVILDFGIARLGDDATKLTQTGAFAGTPAYLAPEYIKDQHVTPRFDVYQMGLILIEALTGQAVVRANSSVAYLMKHIQGEHEVPREVRHSSLAPVLKRAIAVNPEERFADAGVFHAALQSVPVPEDFGFTGRKLAPLPSPDDAAAAFGATLDSGEVFPETQDGLRLTPPPHVATLAEPPPAHKPEPASQPPKKKSALPLVFALMLIFFVGVIVVIGAIVILVVAANANSDDAALVARDDVETIQRPGATSPAAPGLPENLNAFMKLTGYGVLLPQFDSIVAQAHAYRRSVPDSNRFKDPSKLVVPRMESIGDSAESVTFDLHSLPQSTPRMRDLDKHANQLRDRLTALTKTMESLEEHFAGSRSTNAGVSQRLHSKFLKALAGTEAAGKEMRLALWSEWAKLFSNAGAETNAYEKQVFRVADSAIALAIAYETDDVGQVSQALKKVRADGQALSNFAKTNPEFTESQQMRALHKSIVLASGRIDESGKAYLEDRETYYPLLTARAELIGLLSSCASLTFQPGGAR